MDSVSPSPAPNVETPTHIVLKANESRVVPLIEESVTLEKRWVDQGGFRVTKRVDAHEQLVEQALRAVEVEVERRPVGELLAGMVAPAPRQEGATWILSVVEEVLVTEKRLMLKEEIRITRSESSHTHSERVNLRREEVSIERLEPGAAPDFVSP